MRSILLCLLNRQPGLCALSSQGWLPDSSDCTICAQTTGLPEFLLPCRLHVLATSPRSFSLSCSIPGDQMPNASSALLAKGIHHSVHCQRICRLNETQRTIVQLFDHSVCGDRPFPDRSEPCASSLSSWEPFRAPPIARRQRKRAQRAWGDTWNSLCAEIMQGSQ